MTRLSPLAGGAVAVLLWTTLTGCGGQAGAAGPERPSGTDPAFGVSAATAVLAAFDQADSAASAAGDLAALRAQEVSPSLDGSIAAVNKARLVQRSQPGFQHVDPLFALPTSDLGCFLVSAQLRLTGEELPLDDVSQFVRTPQGSWKISHNVQIGQDGRAALAGLGSAPVVASTSALPDTLRQQLAAQVFARTTGGTPDTALLASNVLLDTRFAGGWAIYTQQMSGAGMAVKRTLDRADWSPCAARTTAGTLVFLTLSATDTITRAGGRGDVSLTPAAPDLAALGRSTAVHGRSLRISRIQTFLLLVPANGTGPAGLLGLADAPVSLDVVS